PTVRTLNQSLQVSIISPKIELNDESINIKNGFTLFESSAGNQSKNPIVQSIVSNFNSFFNTELTEFRLNNQNLKEKLEDLRNNILEEYNSFFKQTNKKIEITLDPL